MDKINKYKTIIKSCLEEEVRKTQHSDLALPTLLTIDVTSNRFIVLAKGWRKKRYLHYFIYHIEIINQKVWIHEDRTDSGIAYTLSASGIPKSDILLGYLPEYARQSSEFAVA